MPIEVDFSEEYQRFSDSNVEQEVVMPALDVFIKNTKADAPVDTGRLRNSIRRVSSRAVAEAPYASFVNFRTGFWDDNIPLLEAEIRRLGEQL